MKADGPATHPWQKPDGIIYPRHIYQARKEYLAQWGERMRLARAAGATDAHGRETLLQESVRDLK